MARKNRVSVPDGLYHVTAKVANGAMLLKPDAVKAMVLESILGASKFSGVEVYAWCIMDNHVHLLVHVPTVPEQFWLDRRVAPDSWAFGMRPVECNTPLWIAPLGDSPHDLANSWDSPCVQGTHDHAFTGDSPRGTSMYLGDVEWRYAVMPRPSVNFTMSDEEMLKRLGGLYPEKRVEEIGEWWKEERRRGNNAVVDECKEKYCHRMYNLSQFVKTLKETVAMKYKKTFKHQGCFWNGRFYSGVVENDLEVLSVVAGYIVYNPVKAKLVESARNWRYSSYAAALGDGPIALSCRDMFSRMFRCDWKEARKIIEEVLDDKLPDGVMPEQIEAYYEAKRLERIRETRSRTRRVATEDHLAVNGDNAIKIDPASGNGADPRVDFVRSVEDSGELAITAELGKVVERLRAAQAMKCNLWIFKKAGFVGRSMLFAMKSVGHLAVGFPRTSINSVKDCQMFSWTRRSATMVMAA